MAASMKRWPPVWLIPFLLFTPGCGDGGGEGGFGAVGTIGGLGTTALVYVSNSGSNNISGYTINGTTGGLALVPGSPFTNIATPSAVAVSSEGFFAFATNGQANTVTAFRVGTDGALIRAPSTSSDPNPAPVGTAPSAVAISRNSEFLYVANRGSDSVIVFRIGSAGTLTRIPAAGSPNPAAAGGSAPVSLALSPNGRFLFVANSASNTVSSFEIGEDGLMKLVPATASIKNPASTGGTAPSGLALSLSGQFLYVTNRASDTVTIFQVESGGLLTLVPVSGAATNPITVGGTDPNGLIVAPNGQFLYTANEGGTVSAFTIGSTGLLALVPASGSTTNPIPAGTGPSAITMSEDGLFLYVANSGGNVSAYTVGTDSGLLTPLTPLVGNPFLAGSRPSGITTPRRLQTN